MNDLLKLSAQRRKQATKVLIDGKVMETLARYGTPEIIGSYALDVMYDPDIDIVVLTKDLRASSLAALNDFLAQRGFQKYEYGDFVKFRRTNRPRGFIVNLRAKTDDVNWEVEIWFLTSITKEKTMTAQLNKKLDSTSRMRILQLKHERATSGLSKHHKSSVDIYREVLGPLRVNGSGAYLSCWRNYELRCGAGSSS